ncbi:GNAT family N-acetyltransferase [Pedococcus bigeumensis]|uniref:GNAT family N-acetyltransferase n=1 Tax=Pedococcus bigeumensis TaxID=433644 RepID=UPI001F4F1C3E|nr:GNAT family N-acetyltransferase [Pedococcus bigeumensis]
MSGPDLPVRSAGFDELSSHTAYRLWALRSEVFVVEQAAAYLDLDGRDVEAGTRHLWVEADGLPVATLRVLDDGDVWRIGRVATASAQRGRGLAAGLVRAALAECVGRPVVLDAQSYLTDWYAGFGFVVHGAEYVDEDGIPHTPMRLDIVAAPEVRQATDF